MPVVKVNKWKMRPFVVSTAREKAWKGTHRTKNKLHVTACSYESVSPLAQHAIHILNRVCIGQPSVFKVDRFGIPYLTLRIECN